MEYINEIWKPVKGFESFYKISNYGRIYSFHKKRLLKPSIAKNGYNVINLSDGVIKKLHYAHRLIAKAFIPNPHLLPFINHKNLNKIDNSLENLEWCTHQENIIHAAKNGRVISPTSGKQGKDIKTSKRVAQIDKEGRIVKIYDCTYDTERLSGFDRSKVSAVARGERASHKGFSFKYV